MNRNEDDLEKIILDLSLPIHLFSAIFKKFIEEYRILHDMNVALSKADFKGLREFKSLSIIQKGIRCLSRCGKISDIFQIDK